MFEKLSRVEERYNKIAADLCDPAVVADISRYTALMKEQKHLTPVVETFARYKTAKTAAEEARELLQSESDPELCDLAREELKDSEAALEQLQEQLKILLLPRDPNDDKNVIIEIRGGAGGDESALFAGVLYRMYSMYAEQKGFKSEILSENATELGGYKEDRHLPLLRRRGAAHQQNLLRHSHYPPAHRHGGGVPGRAQPA